MIYTFVRWLFPHTVNRIAMDNYRGGYASGRQSGARDVLKMCKEHAQKFSVNPDDLRVRLEFTDDVWESIICRGL